jgi:hypothetical protein
MLFQNSMLYQVGHQHRPATLFLFRQSNWDILEGKASCRRHRITQKTASGESLTNGVDPCRPVWYFLIFLSWQFLMMCCLSSKIILIFIRGQPSFIRCSQSLVFFCSSTAFATLVPHRVCLLCLFSALVHTSLICICSHTYRTLVFFLVTKQPSLFV